jgi:hypothetical protein
MSFVQTHPMNKNDIHLQGGVSGRVGQSILRRLVVSSYAPLFRIIAHKLSERNPQRVIGDEWLSLHRD